MCLSTICLCASSNNVFPFAFMPINHPSIIFGMPLRGLLTCFVAVQMMFQIFYGISLGLRLEAWKRLSAARQVDLEAAAPVPKRIRRGRSLCCEAWRVSLWTNRQHRALHSGANCNIFSCTTKI
jgi:hypothetical protein